MTEKIRLSIDRENAAFLRGLLLGLGIASKDYYDVSTLDTLQGDIEKALKEQQDG